MGEINTHPTVCNICGGKVVYCSNERIYGRKYGSGFCYLCTNCGAYVGTHRPSPHTALGLLADAPMREGKKLCHDLFDKLWKGPKNQGARRTLMYAHLANLMEVSIEDCHFGYFDICQLRQAYRILLRIEKMTDLLENHIPYEQICEKSHLQGYHKEKPPEMDGLNYTLIPRRRAAAWDKARGQSCRTAHFCRSVGASCTRPFR